MKRFALAAVSAALVLGCSDASRTIDRAEARHAIESQLYAYTYALDSGDLDALAELFQHAVMRVEGTDVEYRGGEAVRQTNVDFNIFYDEQGTPTRYRPGTTPRTHHVTTNVTIDLSEDGKSATARSYVTVFQFAPAVPLRPIIAAGYRDRFELVDSEWRWTERVHLLEHVGDVSRHLWQPPPGQ